MASTAQMLSTPIRNGVMASPNSTSYMVTGKQDSSINGDSTSINGVWSNANSASVQKLEESTASINPDVAPPDRSSSTSAPPQLELSTNSLFAWDHTFANVFTGQYDIRATEDYYRYYEEHGKSNPKLPPPLEPMPFVADMLYSNHEQEVHEEHTPVAPKFLQGYMGNGYRYEDDKATQETLHEASQQLQRMNIGRTQNIPVPSQNIWTPLPRKGEAPPQKDHGPYATSPSETALKSAQYVFGEDEKEQMSGRYHNNQYGNKRFNHDLNVKQIDYNSGYEQNSNASISSSNEAPAPRSNIICRYYAAGYCSRGDKCYYSHDADAAQQVKGSRPEMRRPAKSKSPRVSANGLPPVNGNHNNSGGTSAQSTNQQTAPISQPTLQTNLVAPIAHAPAMNGGINLSSNHNGNISSVGLSRGLGSSLKIDVNSIQQNNGSLNNSGNLSVNGNQVSLTSSVPTPVSVGVNIPNNSPPSSGLASPTKSPTSSVPVSPRSGQQPDMYTNFEQLIGKIYMVSKDQQGCRFLQKKLEEQDPQTVDIIFNEVYEHINELMIDPFGNYLCQKLLEHCTDQHRYRIVEKVAPDLVSISKNMHGTRAVQKMIECLSSPAQIDIVKRALGDHVVELIQDLNGNHVIQRCLHRLAADDNNQFIYNAVTSGNNCVQVATHRHGCCVLQRCIDNASEKQKVQLITEIIKNALTLVQDPYGNYVVQYVLDLPFPDLVELLAQSFVGHVRHLATQKFSSNVIEKSLNVAKQPTRYLMIKEILAEGALAQLLQDPFANYVIQTALNVSEPQQHQDLIDSIKPFLNQLKNTPYGKRIQNKIAKETTERSKHHK